MRKIKAATICVLLAVFLFPQFAAALSMPTSVSDFAASLTFTARAYVVVDKDTGQILASKEASISWPPASLTKLVTAMVFLDTKPNLSKIVSITKSDEEAGGCKLGGACLSTKAGVRYKLKDLFYSSLIASANNATMAQARSTGMTAEDFVTKMNEKVQSLGALNTVFVEPTGISPSNITTASDYTKIAAAAFAYPDIQKVTGIENYKFSSVGGKKYNHKIKNTNKLLQEGDLTVIGGKTGYLDESKYNFVTEVKDKFGNHSLIVVFGAGSSSAQFAETKQLAMLSSISKMFNASLPTVAGATVEKNIK